MKTSAVGNAAQTTLPDRRLKVAVLNRIFSSAGGGAERYSIALVEQLAAKHEIHVFAQEINHAWPGVTYHAIPCWFKKPRWLNQLWYAYATWRATRQGFDIVHSHENVWHGHVQTMHVKTVKRSLLEKHGGYLLAVAWLKIGLSPRLWAYLAMEHARMSPRQGRTIVAVSRSLGQELVAQYPLAASHLAVVTPGVAMPQQVLTRAQARRLLNVPVDGCYALLVANDYTRKGLPTLLEALRGMAGVQLLVAGHPAQIGHYRSVADTLRLMDRVHFLGSLQDMAPAYFAANVLAHPTLEDSFAMAVLEAMAHGLPVVVSTGKYCGISSMLSDGVNALLLQDPLDAGELKAKLQQIIVNDPLAQRQSMEAEKFASQHSWRAASLAYDEIYQKRSFES